VVILPNHIKFSLMKNSKQPLLIVLGIVFWFAAAIIVRLSGTAVFTENNPFLMLYFLLAFPASYGLILITKKVARLDDSEIFTAVAIMTYTATFLDGIALTWFGQLYGATHEVRLYGAAWILWGVGAGLLLGQLLSNRIIKN
jgi:hypothetical protein